MRFLFAIVPLLAVQHASGASSDADPVRASLLSEHATLAPGATAWLGLRLEHAAHWHTYWIDPGDSGLPTTLTWQLPPGYRAGAIAWPAPQRIKVGDLYNFGYEGDLLLPVPIEVPADAGGSAHLAVVAKWLVCREECIPGKADLAIDLPVRSGAAGETANAPRFAAARAALPQPASWSGSARLAGDRIEVVLRGAELAAGTDAFVVQRKLVNYAPPRIARHGSDTVLTFATSDYFSAAPEAIDLVLRSGSRASSVHVPFVSSD